MLRAKRRYLEGGGQMNSILSNPNTYATLGQMADSFTDPGSSRVKVGSYIAKGAASGASVGAVAGPWGAAIGAVVGAAGGWIVGGKAKKKETGRLGAERLRFQNYQQAKGAATIFDDPSLITGDQGADYYANGGQLPGPKGKVVLYKPKDTTIVSLSDKRKINPATGKLFSMPGSRSVNVDADGMKSIVSEARRQGVDPYDALAVSYQETNLDKNKPYNLNPDYFGTPTAGAKEGVKSIADQFRYATSMQKKGIVPSGEEYTLQGYNGYGKVKTGHADLEGANSIYGHPIPTEGIDLKKNPLYGKSVISLRDSILKTNPQVRDLVDSTKANGGQLAKRYNSSMAIGGDLKPISNEAAEVEGPSHANGGVYLPQYGSEVEGGETTDGDYVFSKKLGFAQEHKKLARAQGKIENKPATMERINALNKIGERVEKLKATQEFIKQQYNLN